MSNITKPVMLDDTGKSVAQALGNVATAINNLEKVQWGQVKGTLSNQTDLNNNLNSLQSQIDSFTALTPGSTTGDAELTNIRVDSAGHTYNTAGDAVRAIDAQVRDMKTGFDGVVYDSPVEMVQGCDQKLQNEIEIIADEVGTESNDIYVPGPLQFGSYRVSNNYRIDSIDGEVYADSNYQIAFFPVTSGEVYYLKLVNNSFAAFTTTDGTSFVGVGFNNKSQAVVAPDDANYILVSKPKSETSVGIYDAFSVSADLDYILSKPSDNYHVYSGYFSASLGRFTSNASVRCKFTKKLKCDPGDVLLYKGVGASDAVSVVYYTGDTIIKTDKYNSPNDYTYTTAPQNSDGVMFVSYAETTDPGNVVLEVKSKFNKIAQAVKYSDYAVNGIKNLTYIHAGFLQNDGTYAGTSNCLSKTTELLPCEFGDTFLYKGRGEQSAVSALYYLNGAIVGNYIVHNTTNFSPITIPSGVDGVVFTSYEVTNDPDDVILEVKKTEYAAQGSKLVGKSIACEGDSIMQGAGLSGGFAKIIADSYQMTYQNNAIGGGLISKMTGYHCISEAFSDLPEYDYIIFDGGVNDVAKAQAYGTVTLGTITSGYDDVTDLTTFCGALEHICYLLRTTFATKKVGYIFTHRIFYTETWDDVWKPAMIQIFKKWGVPYLDLEVLIPPLNYIDSLKNTYTYNQDGWHPNAAGYNQYYVPFITEWLESL